MHKVIFIILAALFAFGCQAEEPQKTSETAKRYPLTGKVISVDKAAKTARIEHEEIVGFMEKMTMDFPIREDWVWEDLVPGAIVYAELVVDSTAKDPYWLEKVSISAAPNPDMQQPEIKEPEQVGKEVPNFTLTDQDGKRFSLRDYRGKVLAVTFIYRECPLPEFCIKMSRNFSDAALKLNADAENKDKIRLLSISFDPGRDTPAKLREYGIGYLGNPEKPDFTVWKLAVGPDAEVRKIADFFGLKYEIDEQDKAQFNHSLVTAVIDREGKVAKMLPSNRWSADDLLREVKAVANK
ncbi:MAG TPA: SCO family protein [Pyrinomonadaceae bacterium]|nr:SCO family protein [Pyrinomonadaceae bacterium]